VSALVGLVVLASPRWVSFAHLPQVLKGHVERERGSLLRLNVTPLSAY
jgi:hypothetical protein